MSFLRKVVRWWNQSRAVSTCKVTLGIAASIGAGWYLKDFWLGVLFFLIYEGVLGRLKQIERRIVEIRQPN